MKRKHLLLTLSLIVTNCFAQDYFVDFENDTIKCEIIELKKGKLKFISNSKKYKKTEKKVSLESDIYLDNSSSSKTKYQVLPVGILKDIFISDESVIYNPQNIKIQEPEEGFAHVYFFRPYVYLNSALGCKVKYKGEKLFNLKTNGFFLHKVEAGKIHKYYKSRLGKDNVVEINAENKKIYFVRGVLGSVNSMPGSELNSSTGMPMMVGGERNIVLDISNNAKYLVMGMKKKLKAY